MRSYKDFIFLSLGLILTIAIIDIIYLVYKATVMNEPQIPLPILLSGIVIISSGLVVNYLLYKKNKEKDS